MKNEVVCRGNYFRCTFCDTIKKIGKNYVLNDELIVNKHVPRCNVVQIATSGK